MKDVAGNESKLEIPLLKGVKAIRTYEVLQDVETLNSHIYHIKQDLFREMKRFLECEVKESLIKEFENKYFEIIRLIQNIQEKLLEIFITITNSTTKKCFTREEIEFYQRKQTEDLLSGFRVLILSLRDKVNK